MSQVIFVGIDVHVKSWNAGIRHARHQLENFSVKPDLLGLAGPLPSNCPDGEYRSVH